MTVKQEQISALVIGAGPAGLMAASQIASSGQRVIVTEAKPSIGRKFLMAGKSGLNLTKDEPRDQFLTAFGESAERLSPMLQDLGPQEVKAWARDLGASVFTGSTGRVFPDAMKSSPLLRAWAGHLIEAGVEFRTRWRWQGWDGPEAIFETPDGKVRIRADVTVLALGGGSWARLGSDGQWIAHLGAQNIVTAPFRPANFGLNVGWSDHMAKQFGSPVKSTSLSCGSLSNNGEFVISAKGLEGGAIYSLGPELRRGTPLILDLFPKLSAAQIAARLAKPRGKASLSNHFRRALRLTGSRLALLQEFGRPLPSDPMQLAERMKSLPIIHDGPRPMDEAISTAGGVRWDDLDDGLMLKAMPGVYCAGEMIDWDAPTGGYLVTACLATGRWAGQSAAARLNDVSE